MRIKKTPKLMLVLEFFIAIYGKVLVENRD